MRQHTRRSRLLLLFAGAVAACGESPPGSDEVARRLAGTSWAGRATFEQTIAGKTVKVEVPMGLAFDDQGVPLSLPSLGMISPWRLYVARDSGPDPSPAEPLAKGGSLWAYCPYEADGSANELKLEPGERQAPAGATGWKFRAVYKFADLTKYQLYDYEDPGAPEVRMDASDVYRLSAAEVGERLTVESRASGVMVGSNAPIELRLDAQLIRREVTDELSCRLAPPAP